MEMEGPKTGRHHFQEHFLLGTTIWFLIHLYWEDGTSPGLVCLPPERLEVARLVVMELYNHIIVVMEVHPGKDHTPGR